MDSQEVMDLLKLRAAGRVDRYHVVPTIHNQTVAEHSAQVLTIILALHPDPSIVLVKAALWHDSAERVTGDSPATAKSQFPELRDALEIAEINVFMANRHTKDCMFDLTDEEAAWLKAADTLELIMWCQDEFFMGNKHALVMIERAVRWLESWTDVPTEVREVLHNITTQPYRSFV